MAREKLRWVPAEEIIETLVQPEAVKRWYDIDGTKHESPEIPDKPFLLRTCAQGNDECGCVVAYLYGTSDGIFLTRGKDGWYGQKPRWAKNKPLNGGGNWDCPFMRNFSHLCCHVLVAHAWIGKRPEGEVIDHINTDHKNFSADNLRYVTPHENMRSARNMRRLRKMGIDPKRLQRNTLLYIYELNLGALGYFAVEYRLICENNDAEMTIENIEKVVMMAYMNTRKYFFTMKLPSLDVRYQYHYLPALDYKVTEMKGYYNQIEDFNLYNKTDMNPPKQSRVMNWAHGLRKQWSGTPWGACVKESWNVESLYELLQKGIVVMQFYKKNGEVRDAIGTRCPNYIPGENLPKGDQHYERNWKAVPYYDIAKRGWRSFSTDGWARVTAYFESESIEWFNMPE